jgi:hypothetical protein
MATETALLPTTPDAVEAWLRTLANPSYLLTLEENGDSVYPYLFGLAIVKLAKAHREYLRLLARQAADLAAIDMALSGMMTGATGDSRVAQIERLYMRCVSTSLSRAMADVPPVSGDGEFSLPDLRQAAKDSEALDVLARCAELLDDYSDVIDGEDGPLPNRAMSLLTDVQAVLERSGR